MRIDCPYCQGYVTQAKNAEGPNFCPACQKLFYVPDQRSVPPWVFGVLVILTANWQIISR
jgi:hypothetical protein